MRGRIIGKIEEGRKIKDVARVFDIAHSVVSRLWKSFKTTGMCSRRHGGGRVRSTTPAEDRYIVLSAKRNRRTTAQQVANQFLAASGKQISRKTVARRLRGGGLYARRPVVCVPLTRQHRTARLQWCREHHNWTEQDWACVLFSDESRFSLSSDCRRQLIWHESGTAYRPENIQEKDRYPTCSIMVWAGIMINGRTRLHVVANGTMAGQRYIDEVLLPHVRLFRGAVGDKFVFMDDNATCHRTLAVQDCLDSEGIQRLVWPARSPDLNPIENVWDALGRQVAGRNYPPTNKNTLIRALTEEWDKLPQQLLDNVVQKECSKDLIPCDDEKCVQRNDWCNGMKNCEDGSDEAYCKGLTWWGKNLNTCTDKHFKCEDGPCWPKVVHCDGYEDCKDASDEDCDSASKESSEEDDSAEKKATEIPSTTVSESFENYDYDEKIDTTVSVSPEKKTLSDISRTTYTVTFTTESPRSSPNVSLLAPTSEKDFYARKIEEMGIDNQHSTPMETVYTSKIDLSPTSDYRRSYFRPTSLRTTRQINIHYQSTARPYRIRSYRNRMNVPLISRNSSPYRGRYPIQQPRYVPNNRYPYGPVNNNIPSRPNGNDHQRYRNSNYNNGRTNWLNDINNSPIIYKRQRKVPAPFYFRKNYDEIYHADNALAVDRAKNWILSIRNASGGWGKETPRALIALSLANNSFLAGTYENDLMQKYFQVHLAVNLLKEDTPTLNRLAMFVNALIATCQDPTDFQGWDLTELIRSTIGKLTQRTRLPFVNPLVYLSLCLADRNLTHYDIRHLMTYIMTSKDDEATRGEVVFKSPSQYGGYDPRLVTEWVQVRIPRMYKCKSERRGEVQIGEIKEKINSVVGCVIGRGSRCPATVQQDAC
ncbi:transposable element Tcb2 transposase [Trichonephila clavipes]|nr:transposable element Tcb2 transposase [Trichonephila clavipes]